MKKTLLALIALFIIISCSTEKNSFKNRSFHKLTGWFNVLFNAQQAMDEKLNGFEESNEDEYFSILRIEPLPIFEFKEYEEIAQEQETQGIGGINPQSNNFNLLNNQNSTKTGFEKAEEKARKAIKRHGMLIDGEEKNKLISRAYLLLGQSQYYLGKSYDAIESFNYLLTAFPESKHRTEAKVFMLKAYDQSGNEFASEELIEEFKEEQEYSKSDKAIITKGLAQYYLDKEELDSAEQYLNWALEFNKERKTQARMHFILGQLLSKKGEQALAAEHYNKVYKMKPGVDMEVKSQLGIALNYNPEKDNFKNYIDFLDKASKKDLYFRHSNEFDYGKALINYKAGNYEQTKEFLTASLAQEKTDPYVRGKAYELYGDIYFRDSEYVAAQAYYDSAVSEFPNEKLKENLQARLGALDEMIRMFYLIEKNDSILKLANLGPEKQKAFFTDYIAELKKNDEKVAEEVEQKTVEFQTLTRSSGFQNTFGDDSERGKFYFYSDNQRSFGENEFKRIWGNRNLTDNWRVSSKATGQSVDEIENELLGQLEAGNPRRYDLDFYLEKIPSEKDTLDFLKVQRDSTEFKLGLLFFEKFNDGRESIKTLSHLLETPPMKDELKQKTLYHLYRVSKLSGDVDGKEEYESIILNDYPESVYAEFIQNPVESLSEFSSPEAISFYEETYEMYKEEKFANVIQRSNEASRKFPKDYLLSKFNLLKAFALGKTEGKSVLEKELNNIILAYDGTEEAEKAKELTAAMKAKKIPPQENQAQPRDQSQNTNRRSQRTVNEEEVNP